MPAFSPNSAHFSDHIPFFHPHFPPSFPILPIFPAKANSSSSAPPPLKSPFFLPHFLPFPPIFHSAMMLQETYPIWVRLALLDAPSKTDWPWTHSSGGKTTITFVTLVVP